MIFKRSQIPDFYDGVEHHVHRPLSDEHVPPKIPEAGGAEPLSCTIW